MSFDHRAQIKNILLGVTATLDDGFTAADIMVLYWGGPENLKYLFYVTDYHAVITIERPSTRESGDGRRIQGEPLRYDADVPVNVVSVDKTGCTATKLLNKIRQSMETQIETNAQQPTYTLIKARGEPTTQVMGGYDPLWMDKYILRYRPMVS